MPVNSQTPPDPQSAQGAKKAITSRLNRMKNAGRADQRENLVHEIKHYVNWLYEDNKKNERNIRSIRAVLDK